MPSKDVDLDSILAELGQFGRYQIRNYLWILLPIMFGAIYNAQYIFAAANMEYRCKVPECESSPPELIPGYWGVWALSPGDVCNRFEVLGDTCSPDSFNQNLTVSCDVWVYENDLTIVNTFNMACQEWQRTLVGTMHSVGLLAALPLTAYVSDTFGRRIAFITTAVAAGLMGLIRSFSPNYIMYLIFEFLDATLGSGVYSSGFILALEMVGLNRRVLGGNIISCSFALGQALLGLIAWGIPYWRTLTRVLYAPSLLFIFYFFVVEESVRWLLSKGKKKEAARIIFKAAVINRKKLSPESIRHLTEETEEEKEESKSIPELEATTTKTQSLTMQVLRSKILISRVCVCSFWWITLTFIYYGLSINSVSLGGNMYVNYILTCLVEIPGYAMSVMTLDRFGRKGPIMIAFFICGASLIGLPFVTSENLQWLQISLNMLGKLCISMAFSSIYIYTSELFPTQVRHSLLGICSMVGRIGSIVAPQTPLLMSVMESLPYLIFGVMAGTSGLLMLLTPETLRIRLPDTVAQAENISSPKAKSNVNSPVTTVN